MALQQLQDPMVSEGASNEDAVTSSSDIMTYNNISSSGDSNSLNVEDFVTSSTDIEAVSSSSSNTQYTNNDEGLVTTSGVVEDWTVSSTSSN